MTSRQLVEDYRDINSDLVSLAQRDLEAFLATQDLADIEATRIATIPFMSALVTTYGKPAALLAAQYYDDLRAASPNATGRFRATMAPGPNDAQIDSSVRWGVGQKDVTAALSGALQRFVLDSGRNTIAFNSGRDPSPGGWARVPTGSITCGFCLMLASRGPVYRSAATAGEATHYHDRCDCVPTQMWDGDDFPDGYDPDALYDQYKEARAVADSGDPDKIAAVLDAGRAR